MCEGYFCTCATCRTEVNGDFVKALKAKGVEPKIQPRAQKLAQGLVRQLPYIVEDRIYQSPINVDDDQEGLAK